MTDAMLQDAFTEKFPSTLGAKVSEVTSRGRVHSYRSGDDDDG